MEIQKESNINDKVSSDLTLSIAEFCKVKFVNVFYKWSSWKKCWLYTVNSNLSIYKNELMRVNYGKICLNKDTVIYAVIEEVDKENYCFIVSNKDYKVMISTYNAVNLEKLMMTCINISQGSFRNSENFEFSNDLDQSMTSIDEASECIDKIRLDEKYDKLLSVPILTGYFHKLGECDCLLILVSHV